MKRGRNIRLKDFGGISLTYNVWIIRDPDLKIMRSERKCKKSGYLIIVRKSFS
jgi:hypothetical protein